MRWADVDTVERTWVLSGEQTKARRAHAVPLSPIAWDILTNIEERQRTSDVVVDIRYVFTTTGDRPISGFGKAKARIDAAVGAARTLEGADPVPPWTIHDLRRSMASGLGKLGVSRFVISRVLNHADSSVTGIYDRYAYLAEKREALEKWGGYLSRLIAPQGSNVVEFRSDAR
jgi:integrase